MEDEEQTDLFGSEIPSDNIPTGYLDGHTGKISILLQKDRARLLGSVVRVLPGHLSELEKWRKD